MSFFIYQNGPHLLDSSSAMPSQSVTIFPASISAGYIDQSLLPPIQFQIPEEDESHDPDGSPNHEDSHREAVESKD